MINKYFIASLSALIIYSCSSGSGTSTDPNLSGTLESGISVLSAVADDLSSPAVVGAASISDNPVEIKEFSCTGGWSSACSSGGTKTRTANCSNTVVTYIKNVVLSFYDVNGIADASCTGLATAGNYIVRTGNDVVTLPGVGVFTSTSVSANNYAGTSIGGGAKIVKNADSTDSISITGVTASLTSTTGTSVWSNSVYTDPAAPLVLNHLSRDGRTINSGTVIVNNNLLGFTASMAYAGIVYTASCCYPVGGTITTTLSGARAGTATLTFSSVCGSATISTETGAIVSVGMSACSSSIN